MSKQVERSTWWQTYRPIIVNKTRPNIFWQELKPEEFCVIFKSLELPIAPQLETEAAQAIITSEYLWIKANRPTYFVEKGVVDFVSNTRHEGVPSDLLFPTPTVFSWHKDDKLSTCMVITTNEHCILHVSDDQAKGHWSMYLKKNEPPDTTDWQESNICILRAVLGTLAYMRAFPDMVRPGLPDTMIIRNQRYFNNVGGTGRVISLHPKVKAAPSAHVRQGFFRTLRDERYKRNFDGSYRVIYVNPTIVGLYTAKTVMSPA